MNKVLDLSLKYQWYDMIERGEKLIEYRELSPYWVNRLTERKPEPERGDILLGIDQHDIPLVAKKFDAVRFHRGQGSKRTMLFEIKEISVGFGLYWWGAPTDHEVFKIVLGKRLD